MRLIPAALVASTVFLSACVDADLTATVTAPDQASVSGYMQVERQVLDMFGGAGTFCTGEDGSVLEMTEAYARCNISKSGTFAEIFEGEPGTPVPTITDLGDGTARVIFPIGDLTADLADMRTDANMMQMMRPMLQGHVITMRVAGSQIISSTGEIAADGASASFSYALEDALNADLPLPTVFETVVRY